MTLGDDFNNSTSGDGLDPSIPDEVKADSSDEHDLNAL